MCRSASPVPFHWDRWGTPQLLCEERGGETIRVTENTNNTKTPNKQHKNNQTPKNKQSQKKHKHEKSHPNLVEQNEGETA